jgi:hypothetical protein
MTAVRTSTRTLIALVAALALMTAIALMSFAASSVDRAGATWNKSSHQAGATWNKSRVVAGATWNLVSPTARTDGATWN